jgi:UDP-hydrolysing UDP-N-acetyl-D-glucosamine 2-epimerase
MKRLMYISGTRADYGLMKSALKTLQKNGFEVQIIVTGMHLMKEFGNTASEIEKDGFRTIKVDAVYEQDNYYSMAKFFGDLSAKLPDVILDNKPDFMLVLGDRAEMLAAAAIGAYLHVPVAQIHGGDVSSTIDEIARHAITKLAHIHFAATKSSAERITKMGEEPWRVHVVGAPGLDDIAEHKYSERNQIFSELGLDADKPIMLVIQHPVSTELSDADSQMRSTLDAVKEVCEEKNTQAVIIYPNADAGGRRMIDVIKEYSVHGFFKIFPSIPREKFLGLLRYSAVMIGNSSSGIIEAPSFGVPVVNIGSRQDGRERACNVIDVGYDRAAIKKSIEKALYDNEFRKDVKLCISPYGDGTAGKRIADVLSSLKIDKKLLCKKVTY